MAKTLTLAEDGIYLMVIPENGIYHLQLKPKRMLVQKFRTSKGGR